VIIIEIQQLINQLESVFNEGWRPPLSSRLVVDEEACRRIIDQMRVSVPDLIKQAERTLGERDRIIAQANEEASRIVQMAREQATDLVEMHELTTAAHRRSGELIATAEQEVQQMKVEADQYALSTLAALAEQLDTVRREVDNGIRSLEPADQPES